MYAPTLFGGNARRISPILTAVLLTSLALTLACGGSGDDDDDADNSTMNGSMAAPTSAGGGAMAVQDSAEAPSDSDEAAGERAGTQPGQGWQQRIIRTATVTLLVADGDSNIGSALEAVRVLATAKGGYVFSSSSYIEQDRQFAQITLQVPVAQFDATMNELRSASFVDEVVREESSSQDVSEEFVDNESRLRALQSTESRFLALLAEAESIEDILRLEHELNDIRSQIETIQGRQNYLEQVTSFSTITVSLQPSGTPVEPQIADGDGFSLSSIADRAWDHSRGAIEGILVTTITLAIVGIAILPIAILAWFAFRIYRTRIRNATS